MSVSKAIKNSSRCAARFLLVPGLFLLFFSTYSYGIQKGGKKKKKGVEYTMTVAAIRPANNDEAFITVTFLQSQRFYRLPKNADPVYLQLLKESEKNGVPVVVKRANEKSDIILTVNKK
jgi:hypothetical protein